MNHRVAVTGIGIVAPNGVGKAEFAHALESGVSGVGPVTLFDASDLPVRIAGEVKNLESIGEKDGDTGPRPRCFRLAFTAGRMALEDAGLDLTGLDPVHAGVVVGSATLKYALQHEEHEALEHPSEPGYSLDPRDIFLPARMAEQYGFLGPVMNIDMACSSGNQAVLCARDLIRNGRAEVILSGGVDAPINLMIFSSFCQIRAMSKRNQDPPSASRPFDAARDGLILAEGAGFLVLESVEHARRRGARIYAEIVGAGATSDAFHMLIPEKSGDHMLSAMERALSEARMAPDDLDYINAHGTSTRLNDMIESQAIARLLHRDPRALPVSSIKSMIGHTLGAAGAIELIACVLAMERSLIPPTRNLENRDPECADLDYVPNEARSRRVSVCMNNSFAFGGSNSSLVLKSV